jgi:hypothetical protein
MTICLKCGLQIQVGEKTKGRPKSYCSIGCRRAAELEIRRLDSRIADLEDQVTRARLPGYLVLTPAEVLHGEITRLEARLRHLLNGEHLPDSGTDGGTET